MSGATSLVFTDAELMGLYMMLKDRENGLDWTMRKLLNRLERHVYRMLTIEELESIEEAYRSRIDTDGNKG